MKDSLLALGFGLSFSFDGLVEGAIGTGGHADRDDLAIDVDFILLEVNVPTTAGRS